MNDLCAKISEQCDRELAKIYISTTIEIFFIAAALILLLFIKLGCSAFVTLQAFGIVLFWLVIGTAILQWKKKQVLKKINIFIEQNQITTDDFAEFLNAHPLDYEFLRALFITPAQLKNSKSHDASSNTITHS